MNYDLAKELKDAGFPQNGNNIDMQGELCGFLDEKGELCYVPTLSELIEACGERFKQITYWKWADFDKRWTADMWPLDSEQVPQPKAATPEEAVAHLWLALNKKV